MLRSCNHHIIEVVSPDQSNHREGSPTLTKDFSRDRYTWLVYLLLAFYGYFINIIGPITPFLKGELGLSYTVSGLHYTAFAAGILLVGLCGHWLIRRIGRWASLWTGAFGMSICTLLLLVGKTPLITVGATFLMGLVGSLILVIVPSSLADRYGEQRAVALTEANVIASLVATAAPLMVGVFARLPGGWRSALGIVAFTPAFLYYWGFRNIPQPATVPTRGNPVQSARALPILYWLCWFAIVLAVSVEFCMISWSADYLENSLGMLKADAAQAVSLFLGAMILGRLVGSRLVQRFSIYKLLAVSIFIAVAGFLLFWTAVTIPFGLVGLFVTGLGVASLYPMILSLAIGTAPDNSVQASTRATLASGTAILTLPLVLGRLADAVGIREAYGVVLILLIVLFLTVNGPARFRATQVENQL